MEREPWVRESWKDKDKPREHLRRNLICRLIEGSVSSVLESHGKRLLLDGGWGCDDVMMSRLAGCQAGEKDCHPC